MSRALWIDALNMAQQQGMTLGEALLHADRVSENAKWPFPAGDSRGWPFPSVNGTMTQASKAAMAAKVPKISAYQRALEAAGDVERDDCLM